MGGKNWIFHIKKLGTKDPKNTTKKSWKDFFQPLHFCLDLNSSNLPILTDQFIASLWGLVGIAKLREQRFGERLSDEDLWTFGSLLADRGQMLQIVKFFRPGSPKFVRNMCVEIRPSKNPTKRPGYVDILLNTASPTCCHSKCVIICSKYVHSCVWCCVGAKLMFSCYRPFRPFRPQGYRVDGMLILWI